MNIIEMSIDDIAHNFQHDEVIRQLMDTTFTAEQEYKMELETVLWQQDLKHLANTVEEDQDDIIDGSYVFEL